MGPEDCEEIGIHLIPRRDRIRQYLISRQHSIDLGFSFAADPGCRFFVLDHIAGAPAFFPIPESASTGNSRTAIETPGDAALIIGRFGSG
jgi:hypothetical protein